jgi:hypothetical protein
MDGLGRVIRYRVVELSSQDFIGFSREEEDGPLNPIEELLNRGWELYGSPSGAGGDSHPKAYQALVKREAKP